MPLKLITLRSWVLFPLGAGLFPLMLVQNVEYLLLLFLLFSYVLIFLKFNCTDKNVLHKRKNRFKKRPRMAQIKKLYRQIFIYYLFNIRTETLIWNATFNACCAR